MDNEKRLLAATVLSFLVFVGWYFIYKPTNVPQNQIVSSDTRHATVSAETSLDVVVGKTALGRLPVATGAEDKITMPHYEAVFNRQGGFLSALNISSFQKRALVKEGEDAGFVLVCESCNFALPSDMLYEKIEKDPSRLVYEWKSPEVIVRRVYEFSKDKHLIDLTLELVSRKSSGLTGRLGLAWIGKNDPAEQAGGFFSQMTGGSDQKQVVYLEGGKVSREQVGDEAESGSAQGLIAWAGLETRYFLSALISRGSVFEQALTYQTTPMQSRVTLFTPTFAIPSQGKKNFQFSAFVGPKWFENLKEIGASLEKTIDYGWFSFLAIPILWLLQRFHDFIPNWGLSIILLTIFVKVLMNPLTVKSLKSMKAMQTLQPEMKKMKEKFKDDKQRLNQETMNLFKRHKVNPVGGCLPMLMQFPIYIALYRVLFNSIEIYQAPFFGWYTDLSVSDPYYVMPVLLGIFMFFQQKLTPNPSADQAQAKMMMTMMPIMMVVFMLFLPVGLVLYILVNTVMSVLQQYMYTNDIKMKDVLRGRFTPKTN